MKKATKRELGIGRTLIFTMALTSLEDEWLSRKSMNNGISKAQYIRNNIYNCKWMDELESLRKIQKKLPERIFSRNYK